ncbi:MAG: PhnD/SsuA/transferrin family substrate-binding protein, partial [Pseudomonadota bacterium]
MRIWLAGLLGGGLWLGGAVAAEHNPAEVLYLGSVAMDIPAEMHRRLKPLTDYLSGELKRPVQLRLSADLNAAQSEVAYGRVDIAYLTPVAYI